VVTDVASYRRESGSESSIAGQARSQENKAQREVDSKNTEDRLLRERKGENKRRRKHHRADRAEKSIALLTAACCLPCLLCLSV
jgi:hypothetical protein